MENIILSIIIPTRNRYFTLIPVIISITENIKSENYEIIIQDNSDNNEEMIEFLNCKTFYNLKYFYSSEKISMVENSELAISNSNGEYFIFIGDDDIVNPIIIDVVKKIRKINIDCLIYPIPNYYYKNVEFYKIYGFNKPASLCLNKNITWNIKTLNSDDELNRVLNIGGIFILDLPRLYHGLVKKELLYRIKDAYGKFIPGPCPDMTTSVALATLLNHYHHINIPLSISGVSANSEGGKGPTNAHIVKLEDKSWLDQRDIIDWNNYIPKIFTRETIWAQSAFHVLSLSKPLNKFNYRGIYDSMIFSSPKHVLPYVIPLYNLMNIPYSKKKFFLLYAFVKRYVRKILFLLPSPILELAMKLRGDYKNNILISNVLTINQCVEHIKLYNLKVIKNN